jgi:citrate lyase subunit beta/citryl-CoA lyase
MKNYLLRSLLFIPANNKKLLMSAVNSDADLLMPDIEDSVHDDINKQISRDLILQMLNKNEFNKKLIFPRVNDRESGNLLKDIYQLSVDGIGGFVYPKAKTAEDIYFIDKLLDTIEYEKKIDKGTFKLIPLIETTSAVLEAKNICNASARIIAIAFGAEDFLTDLHGVNDKNYESLFVPRSIIAMAARSASIIPIDTVHVNLHDLEDLEKNLIISKKLGFEGMLILHPKEISLAHQYYSPSPQEVEYARKLITLSEQFTKAGKAVAIVENEFIGPPFIKRAKKILDKFQLIESLKKN